MASMSSLEAGDQEIFSINIGSILDFQFNPHDGYLYFIDKGRKTAARLRHERDQSVISLTSINQGVQTAGQGLLGVYFDDADFSGGV